MSDHKPIGKEKELIKWFRKQFGSTYNDKPIFKELSMHTPGFHCLTISIGHAIDGVRTNGWSKATTAFHIYKELKEHKKELDEAYKTLDKYYKRFNKKFEQVKNKMKKFPACPVCHGHQHSDYDGENAHCGFDNCKLKGPGHGEAWSDCYFCNGRGLTYKGMRSGIYR